MAQGSLRRARVCAAAFACLLVVPGVAATAAAAQIATGSIAAVVVDAATGAPIERARVSLDGHRKARALSNAQGRVVLADLPAGRGVLEVSVVGYGLVRRDVDIPASGMVSSRVPPAGMSTSRRARP